MKGWLLSRGSSRLHFQVPGFQGQHEFPVPSAIPGTAQALRSECSTLRPSLFWTLSADPGVPGLPPEILIIEVFLIIVHSGSSGRWFCFFFVLFSVDNGAFLSPSELLPVILLCENGGDLCAGRAQAMQPCHLPTHPCGAIKLSHKSSGVLWDPTDSHCPRPHSTR